MSDDIIDVNNATGKSYPLYSCSMYTIYTIHDIVEPFDKYRILHEREYWMMFWSSQNCTSRRRVRFENFKTSRATINQGMHEQAHAIFCLLYSQHSYFGIKYLQHFIELLLLVLFNFLVDFPFCRPILSTFQPGLCCFKSILEFGILF